MISQTQQIALSILLISLSLNNNNESLFYTSATGITSNTLNNRLRISNNLRPYSNSAAAKGKEGTKKIVSNINGKSRRELQEEEDVVDQREDSIEGQEELFISQNCLNLLAASTDPNHHIRAENFFIFTDAYSNSYFSTNNMTSYSDLPEENQHVFITIACQCGIVGEESNCCQANRAHIDLSELYDSNGYPENMSLQFLEYLYDVCSTTRAVIGTNVLKPSGEGSSMNNNDNGVGGNQEGVEDGTEGSEGTDSSGVEEEGVGPLGITFYRPKPIPPTTADKVDEAAEGSDAVDGSDVDENDGDDSDSEDETNTDAVTEGDTEPREASSTEKLSTGGIIGIAVAGGVVLLALLAFLVMRNKNKKNSEVEDDANIKLSGTSPAPPNMNDVNGTMTNPQAPDDITNVTTDDFSTATENHGGSTPVTTTGSFANASSPSSPSSNVGDNLNKLDSLNDPNDTTMLSNNAKGRGPSELWPGQV